MAPSLTGQALISPLELPANPRRATFGPPDDLHQQLWGIIAPEGAAGDRLLELIKPLRERREQQQKADAVIYRVNSAMEPVAAITWMRNDYWSAARNRPEYLPSYLLILGGPEMISWDLQQLLGADAFVGRLAFDEERAYEAYVEKALRWDNESLGKDAGVILYASRDGTLATAEGYSHLMRPILDIARQRIKNDQFPVSEMIEIGYGDGISPADEDLHKHAISMLNQAEHTPGGLLFSMSHGVGAPRAGWSSWAAQRAEQGAIVVNQKGERLTASDVKTRPFLPGGVWFLFACFGAGTPATSAYYPWLERLHQLGYGSSPARILSALPKTGEAPFVAALPQAALANPNGPLAILGHVDLAWSWAFLDYDLSPAAAPPKSRIERFQDILRSLAQGHRFGVAHRDLAYHFRSLSVELSTLHGADAEKKLPSNELQRAQHAGLWMQREDLRSYVLLGDPAARLPLPRYPAGVHTRSPDARRSTGPTQRSDKEEAVLAALRGSETKMVIAQRYGVNETELEHWLVAFLDAGREALAKLR